MARLLLAAVLGLVCFLGAPGAGGDPNVILISIDTLRADRLGAYGYEAARTPHFDALAKRGRLFENATTPLPRTTPALASMMTGLWPHHHGSREVQQPMGRHDTLARVLRRRGYMTVGVTANALAGREHGLARGFAVFREAESVAQTTGRVTTDRALALAPRRPGRPLFLWVHYLDPHFPYEPPAFWSPRDAESRCHQLRAAVKGGSFSLGSVQSDLNGAASAALADCSRLYEEEIAYTDHEMGRLLTALEARGLLEDAIVVVTSDHGENLGEDGLYYEHGPSLDDASLRIPLVVAGPGIEPGVERDVTRLEDLMPTLLAWIGVDPDERPEADGRDLSSRWRGSAIDSSRRQILTLAESGGALHYQNRSFLRSGSAGGTQCVNGERLSLCWRPGEEPGLYDLFVDEKLATDLSSRYPEVRQRLARAADEWGAEQARQRAVRGSRFKLVARPALEGRYDTQLYDLDSPGGETIDVTDRFPEVSDDLRSLLEAWSADLSEFTAPDRSRGDLEVLRALGYVE